MQHHIDRDKQAQSDIGFFKPAQALAAHDRRQQLQDVANSMQKMIGRVDNYYKSDDIGDVDAAEHRDAMQKLLKKMHKKLPQNVFNEMTQLAEKHPGTLDEIMGFAQEYFKTRTHQKRRYMMDDFRKRMQRALSHVTHQALRTQKL